MEKAQDAPWILYGGSNGEVSKRHFISLRAGWLEPTKRPTLEPDIKPPEGKTSDELFGQMVDFSSAVGRGVWKITGWCRGRITKFHITI
jgi:hypothetical protein